MWPPRREAVAWMYRRPLAQPAAITLLAAAGCAGLLQTPRRGDRRAALGLGTQPRDDAQHELSNWGASSHLEPIWETPICDVVLEEDQEGRRVCGPQVIIGGAMKCGTNTLGSLLQLHPRVKFHYCHEQECEQCHDHAEECLEKFQGSSNMGTEVLWESNYFTGMTSLHDPPRDYEGDEGRYLLARQLPRVDGFHNVTVDKSPSYLDTHLFPDLVAHAKRLLPHAKVIFSLCDPASRLYSEYYHNLKWDQPKLYGSFDKAQVERPANFSEWVAALQEDSEFCRLHPEQCGDAREKFLSTGMYAENLQRWFDTFGKRAILALDIVEGVDLQRQVAQLLAHVGLPLEEYPWEQLKEMGHSFVNHDYTGRGYAWTEAPEAMRKLKGFYSSHNARLADLLREDWPLDW